MSEGDTPIGTNIVKFDEVKDMTEIEALEASIAGIKETIRMIDNNRSGDAQKRQKDRAAALKRLAAAQRSLQATHDRIAKRVAGKAQAQAKAAEKAAKEKATADAKAAKEKEKADAKAAKEAEAADEMTPEELLESHRSMLLLFLEDNDLYWIRSAGQYMQFIDGKWHPIAVKALKTDYPMLSKMPVVFAFDEVMADEGRKFVDATFTFNPVPDHTLNMLRQTFVDRVDDGEPVHWFFRVLMESLGGGREENADHIEALIARKFCEPWDYMLPALVIENRRGGCGKGILGGKLLPTIFGKHAVADNISMRDYIGTFNQHVMGKTAIVINETVEDKYDDNRLKQNLHSPTIMAEAKFMPRMQFDNTAWAVICGNGATGSVKLAGNDIDRRVSVVRANDTLDEWVAKHEGISVAAAKLLIKDTLQYVLTDPIEVGRWMDYIIKRWEHLPMITGLHGEDYEHFVAVQDAFYNEVCAAVFTDPTFSHIRVDTMFDLFVYFNKEKNHNFGRVKRKTFNEHVEYWIAANLPGQVEQFKVHTTKTTPDGRTTIDVWTLTNNPKTLPDNDFRYFTKIDSKVEWKFRM